MRWAVAPLVLVVDVRERLFDGALDALIATVHVDDKMRRGGILVSTLVVEVVGGRPAATRGAEFQAIGHAPLDLLGRVLEDTQDGLELALAAQGGIAQKRPVRNPRIRRGDDDRKALGEVGLDGGVEDGVGDRHPSSFTETGFVGTVRVFLLRRRGIDVDVVDAGHLRETAAEGGLARKR